MVKFSNWLIAMSSVGCTRHVGTPYHWMCGLSCMELLLCNSRFRLVKDKRKSNHSSCSLVLVKQSLEGRL
jgi:hypothetical protein